MSLQFGRKINYFPLLLCLIISLIVGYIMFLVSHQLTIATVFGVFALIIVPIIYSLNIGSSYGYWKVDDQGLHYYDYTTIGKKIKAILLPIVTKESLVKYPTIKSISLVVGEGMTVPEGIGPNGPISASFYVVGSMVEHFESPYYLAFKLNNNQEVALDLSKNAKDKTSIKQVISLLETNTNTKVNLVKEKF